MFGILYQLVTRKTCDIIASSPRNLHSFNKYANTIIPATINLQLFRSKSKTGKSRSQITETESEKESENQDLDYFEDKNTKNLKISVPSMRLDAVIKSGLGVARNKIEVMFYENKVRINGEKVPKKSINCKEGDEIDVIKGLSPTNSEFLTVARIEIISATAEDDSIKLKIKRNKALIIENYPGPNHYK